MREIEFRGLNKNAEFVYGNLLSEYAIGKWGNSDHYSYIEVSSITIGQYIGIKDIFGNKIYEGDLIRVQHEDGRLTWPKIYTDIGYVMFTDRGSFAIKVNKTESKKEFYIAFNPQRTFEIIGNIYQPKQTI
jgi:uncharacterized phage protein (TIGR01671 family)